MTLEAWLPADWTGRFLSGGNGGLTGCIQYTDLAHGSSMGFATVSGNNGHNGTSAVSMYQRPDILEDYVYRAIYTGSIVGQKVAEHMYGEPPATSYFMGCSGGGRQGMKLAQEFPDVYDGIISASPALDFVNLVNWGAWIGTIAGFDAASPEFIDTEQWATIHQEILRQCDGLDGAVDGVLEDPTMCSPIFETLICTGAATDLPTCLSGAQAAKVRQIFQPLYSTNGALLYPALQAGGEPQASFTYLTGAGSLMGADWFKHIVYDPSFDIRTISRADFDVANNGDPYGVSTWNADLSEVRKKGGKILTLHGLEDGLIPSGISDLYYHRVAETMSLPAAALDEFYRYFRVSGLAHCSGGSGAWDIGMYPNGNAAATPENNVLMALVAWVEQGHAPEFIRGTKFVNGSSAQGVEYTRRHCKYPARNVHVGPRNATDENSWQCL